MTRAWLLLALAAAGCTGDKGGDTGAETGATTETGTTDTQTGGTTSTGEARVATILSLAPDHDDGAEVYGRVCQSCHGPDGTGSLSGANLTERLPPMTDDEVVATVLEGEGNMDGYAAALKNQEIADVVHYVTMSFGGGM